MERNRKNSSSVEIFVALDGKDIRAPVQPTSIAQKTIYSIILFVMVHADYCFTYIDVGAKRSSK